MDDLVERLARGEEEAFAELYDACADRLHHYLTVRLGSREDAGDVLQETFVRLTRHHDRLATVRNLTAFVFTVARNEALRHARRQARHSSSLQMSGDVLFAESSEDPLETRERAQQVAAGLARLSSDEREVVELKVYAGLTFREIAEVTETPQGTVATRFRMALARLKQWLAPHML